MIVKKKLRDVTPEEFAKWNNENCEWNVYCDNCVFQPVNCSNFNERANWAYQKDMYSEKFLNQEIEIEQEDVLTEEDFNNAKEELFNIEKYAIENFKELKELDTKEKDERFKNLKFYYENLNSLDFIICMIEIMYKKNLSRLITICSLYYIYTAHSYEEGMDKRKYIESILVDVNDEYVRKWVNI